MEESSIVKIDREINTETMLCVPCLVCGDSVAVRPIGTPVKICEKCRKAILKKRKELENEKKRFE